MKSLAILLVVFTLCGCATGQTLPERLEGKSPEEQREILRVSCLEEAERIGNSDHPHPVSPFNNAPPPDSRQTHRFKTLCRAMNQQNETTEKGND